MGFSVQLLHRCTNVLKPYNLLEAGRLTLPGCIRRRSAQLTEYLDTTRFVMHYHKQLQGNAKHFMYKKQAMHILLHLRRSFYLTRKPLKSTQWVQHKHVTTHSISYSIAYESNDELRYPRLDCLLILIHAKERALASNSSHKQLGTGELFVRQHGVEYKQNTSTRSYKQNGLNRTRIYSYRFVSKQTGACLNDCKMAAEQQSSRDVLEVGFALSIVKHYISLVMFCTWGEIKHVRSKVSAWYQHKVYFVGMCGKLGRQFH